VCWHGCGFGGDPWRRELLDIRPRSGEGGYKLGVDVGKLLHTQRFQLPTLGDDQ
jgi:hypothetical protein